MVEFYAMKNVFYLPEESRWSHIQKHAKQDDIAVKIDTALHTVQKRGQINFLRAQLLLWCEGLLHLTVSDRLKHEMKWKQKRPVIIDRAFCISVVEGRIFLGENLELFGKSRKIILNRLPDDFFINPEVFVDQDITDAFHLQPGNIRKAGLNIIWDMSSRFTNDFKVADDCIDGPLICEELFWGKVGRVLLNPLYRGQDIMQYAAARI